MMLSLAAALVAQPDMSPIDVPYQAIPAFRVYSDCVSDHFRDDERRRGGDLAQVRQANLDAIAACRTVRTVQLERALAAQTDNRLYGNSPANGRAAVREAFDRFDRDYQVEEAGAGPEAPEDAGAVEIASVGDRVEIATPIAPMVLRYMGCVRRSLDQQGSRELSDRARYRRQVDASIRACAETRAAQIALAGQALAQAPDYRDAARRDRAIRQAFDGSDQQLRDMPEIINREIRSQAGNR